MFIKHGDGKIISVIETEEMTDEQKKATLDLSKKIKTTSDETDNSNLKKSER